jgi:triacylglycerol lipase
MTYRLVPAHPWPAGAPDVGAGVRWVVEHAAAHGGDPARVFLMGYAINAKDTQLTGKILELVRNGR